MPRKGKNSDEGRELPKSLQGIERVLNYLNRSEENLFSIRSISEHIGLSMRVTKNILLQLEKLNQVKRVVEKNKVLPKWGITKLGEKVIESTNPDLKPIKKPSKLEKIVQNITIPKGIQSLKDKSKATQEQISTILKNLQINLSKSLGIVLNLNNPEFEDLMETIVKKLKHLRREIQNLPKDPIQKYKLRKLGEGEKKVKMEKAEKLFREINFFNSVILNHINSIQQNADTLLEFLDNGLNSKAFSIAQDLKGELRLQSQLINKRKSLKVNSHALKNGDLEKLEDNEITSELLEDIIEINHIEKESSDELKSTILKLHDKLDSRNIIPLYEFYQLLLDETPNISISISDVERTINSLADKGYVPGLKIIEQDEDHYLKLVQLVVQDFSKNELEVIKHSLQFKKFNLSDMVGATGWSTRQTREMLDHLTNMGILKFSDSHLHGKRWYIVSEKV